MPAPVTHYENFPVASLLCPPQLRAPIAAIYAFARTADDLADEGELSAAQRLADLQAYRTELQHVAAGQPPQPRWAAVFGPVQWAIQTHGLPLALLDDLLSAFLQDVDMTERGATYPDRAALLDYCRRSANPIGRLLLHLYGVQSEAALRESDAICSALQLINFWQDLSVDLPRARHYLTDADCAAHGVSRAELVQRLAAELGRAPQVIGDDDSDRPLLRIAWCSGGAQSLFEQAVEQGVDVYLSGEVSEQNVHLARESGVIYIAAGHHATERYGVRALAEHLAERFDLQCEFVDIDSPV